MENVGFVEKAKGFLLKPTETFNKVKEETLGEVLKYFIIWIVIYGILFAIVMMVAGGIVGSIYGNIPGFSEVTGATIGLTCALGLFFLVLIGGIIGLFVGGAIVHLGVLLVGGKKGYLQTVKAVGYGYTPQFLLGWIPFVGIIASIWALIVQIIGVRELQEISTGKAIIAAFIVPLVIGVIIGCIISAFMFAYIGSLISPPSAP